MLALGMRLAWGNYLFARQLRRRCPVAEPGVLALFAECRQTMGIRRPLTLLEAPELDGPALFGCFRLKLLLREKMIAKFKKTSPWPVLATVLLIALGLVSLTDAQTKKGAEALTGKAVGETGTQPVSKAPEEAKRSAAASESSAKSGPLASEKTEAGLTVRGLKLPDRLLWASEPSVSADGRFIADGGHSVFELASGEMRQVSDSYLMYPKFSPDGKQILAVKRDEPLLSGPPKDEVVVFDLGWTPDSRYLVFGRGKRIRSEPWVENFELWRVPARGGEPEKLGTIPECGEELRVSPGGKHVAFTVSSSKREVWVMENFLPEEKIASK